MQKAISYAYTNVPNDGVARVYQSQVKTKGKIPTLDEFIIENPKDLEEGSFIL